ncbi:hypothetical protein [Pseudomonas sp. FH1]|uniref:hypothetical protein n=1 Tax=Pseudomonas sp. FH1 TaxID=1284392 RepID=UPI0003DD951F|nr:hypothetical protein [Pseudomonas sp. FH1]ETK23365.1 hypothetical protein H096_10122 [Pseudomonas sp. FH1]
MSIINEIRQFIAIKEGEIFSFTADDQLYSHATLLRVQQGSALIKTAGGAQEAIAIEGMKLAIKLIPQPCPSTGSSVPLKVEQSKELAIGFPLENTGIRAYTYQGVQYAEPLYQGAVAISNNPTLSSPGPQVSSVTIVTINVPIIVEITELTDGNHNINIYEQTNYPPTGASLPPPPQRLDVAYWRAEEERRERERLAFIMDYS